MKSGQVILLLIVLAGCGPAAPPGAASRPAPTMAELGQATFTGIHDEPIRLQNGRYPGEPLDEEGAERQGLKLVTELHATGDLDGDGHKEAAVLLVEEGGGLGPSLYVAAMGIWEGSPISLGTQLVGEGVQVRGLEVVDGRVRMEIVEHGPEDPPCCPTWMARREWTLRNDELVEVASREEGRLALDSLSGSEWRLTRLKPGPLATGRTVITAMFDRGWIRGSGGCNEYSGLVHETAPGALEIGPLSATRRSCPGPLMESERLFLSALQRAIRYGFSMGRLALSFRLEDGTGVMLFVSGSPAEAPRQDAAN